MYYTLTTVEGNNSLRMPKAHKVDSTHAWVVAIVSLVLTAVASGIYYLVGIAIVPRADELGIPVRSASLPYGLAMLGMGVGGIAMGWFADRRGPFIPAVVGTLAIVVGSYWVSFTSDFNIILISYAVLLGGIGNGALVTPLFANAARWFEARRGLATAVVGSGNALGGAMWPPIFNLWVANHGFSFTYELFAMIALITMLPLCLVLRASSPDQRLIKSRVVSHESENDNLLFSPQMIVILLCVAVVGCCTAMSMPLVHLPNYMAVKGFSLSDGALLLAILMATSMVARICWGFVCDYLGGLRTLFLTSSIQALGLVGIAFSDGFVALYGVAILFGLGFGGILPCYPVILREHLSPERLGFRVGLIVLFGATGMGLGPEIAGRTFAELGTYFPGFAAGFLANVLNLILIGTIILFGVRESKRPAFA